MDDLLKAVLQVASSPGGQAALMVLFRDHGVPQERIDIIMFQLPVPKPPKA